MAKSEILDQFRQKVAPLEEGLGQEQVEEGSRRLRASWLQKPEQRAKEGKLVGKEVQFLDALTPLIVSLTNTIYDDPRLFGRFFNQTDPRPWPARVTETAVRCFIEIEKGEELNGTGVKRIIEKVIAQEPPSQEVLDLMEKLKETQS